MNADLHTLLESIHSSDGNVQGEAYQSLLKATNELVDWTYEAWDGLVVALSNKDSRLRSIAAQLLVNLAAKSDPEDRIVKDFPSLFNVTRDAKFVTARHALQAIWKVGMAGDKQQKLVLDGLALRYKECASEKNCTLIRYDVIACLRNLYEATGNETLRKNALEWIGTEPDVKYRQKYMTLFK